MLAHLRYVCERLHAPVVWCKAVEEIDLGMDFDLVFLAPCQKRSLALLIHLESGWWRRTCSNAHPRAVVCHRKDLMAAVSQSSHRGSFTPEPQAESSLT